MGVFTKFGYPTYDYQNPTVSRGPSGAPIDPTLTPPSNTTPTQRRNPQTAQPQPLPNTGGAMGRAATEVVKQAGQQQPSSPPPSTQPAPWDASTVNWQNPAQQDIVNYGKSRGIENFDPGGYWMSKWNELNARGKEIGDPNYAFMRLSKADEYTPQAQRYGGAGSPVNPRDIQQQIDMAGGGGGGERAAMDGGGGAANLGASGDMFGNTQIENSYSALIKQLTEPQGLNAQQFEAIRQPIDKARRVALTQATSELANRGLLGEPGHDTGAGRMAAGKIEEILGPEFATATQNAATQNEFNRRTNLLGALQGGTARQGMLADVALKNLSENRMWNQFLANFGLTQQQVAAQIAQGNTSQLIELLKLYTQSHPGNTTTTSTSGRSLSG